MYQKYNNIITDKITDTSAFFHMRKNTEKDIFEIISWYEHLSLNWFTELTWNLWNLWNIQDNIPLYIDCSKKINHIPSDDELLNIIMINISLIKNYFRNHIILKNIIKNNFDIYIIRQYIINIISPLILLIEEIKPTDVNEYINCIKNSNDMYEVLLNFELLIQHLSELINTQQSKIYFGQNINFLDYIDNNESLHTEKTKYHLQSLKLIFQELYNIEPEIETFLLYWSVARWETKQDSDLLDGILIIKDSSINNYESFRKSLSSIIKSNQILLNDTLIKNKHPFHYMFQWDLNSYSSQYKVSFANKFKPIFGKDVTKIDNFFDENLDNYFWKYSFINTFQKFRNECWSVLENEWNFDSFCNELKYFMKKWFFLSALAVNGIFVDEDVCINKFKEKYIDLSIQCDNVISILQNDVLSKDDIIKILNFYYITLKHVYNLR